MHEAVRHKGASLQSLMSVEGVMRTGTCPDSHSKCTGRDSPTPGRKRRFRYRPGVRSLPYGRTGFVLGTVLLKLGSQYRYFLAKNRQNPVGCSKRYRRRSHYRSAQLARVSNCDCPVTVRSVSSDECSLTTTSSKFLRSGLSPAATGGHLTSNS